MESVIYTREELRPLQVICIALPVGVILFTLVALSIGSDGTPTTDLAALTTMRLVHAALTAFALFAQKLFFVRALTGKIKSGQGDGPQPFLTRYRTAMIVRLALVEGAALFGLVILVIASTGGVLRNDSTLYLHLIPVLLLIGIAQVSFPTQQKLVELERQLRV